jgi:hypothetical protein
LGALVWRAAVARAETPPAIAEAPKSWRDLVTVEGLVDAYASWRPGGNDLEDASLHVFDAASDSFVLAYAELAVGVKPQPVGLRLDLGFGPVADATASNAGALTETFKHIQQAYVSFAFPAALPVTLDVGKFVTPVGAEVIEARSNWNYSRSFLFDCAIPFTNTGLRLSAALTSRSTVTALLVNGWDLVFDDNVAKTFGLSLTFTAPTGTTVVLGGLVGKEQPAATSNDWRLLADLVVAHVIGPLGLMLNADLAKKGRPSGTAPPPTRGSPPARTSTSPCAARSSATRPASACSPRPASTPPSRRSPPPPPSPSARTASCAPRPAPTSPTRTCSPSAAPPTITSSSCSAPRSPGSKRGRGFAPPAGPPLFPTTPAQQSCASCCLDPLAVARSDDSAQSDAPNGGPSHS